MQETSDIAKGTRAYPLYVQQAEQDGVEATWFLELDGKVEVDWPEPAQHPARRQSATWKQVVRARGPVGLLVQEVVRIGGRPDMDLQIHMEREQTLSIVHTPYQYFARLTLRM